MRAYSVYGGGYADIDEFDREGFKLIFWEDGVFRQKVGFVYRNRNPGHASYGESDNIYWELSGCGSIKKTQKMGAE